MNFSTKTEGRKRGERREIEGEEEREKRSGESRAMSEMIDKGKQKKMRERARTEVGERREQGETRGGRERGGKKERAERERERERREERTGKGKGGEREGREKRKTR